MFLLPLSDPDGPSLAGAEAWKFFVVCDDPRGEKSDFLDAVEALGTQGEPAFAQLLSMLTKLAVSGRPWKALLPDAKRFHEVGEITFRRADGQIESEKVWSFKQGKKLRLLWCYGGKGKVILFGHTMMKNQNTVDPSDVAKVKAVMQDYVLAQDRGQISIAGGVKNEQAFGELFPKGKERPDVGKKEAPGRNRR